jgi:hypothetical protein
MVPLIGCPDSDSQEMQAMLNHLFLLDEASKSRLSLTRRHVKSCLLADLLDVGRVATSVGAGDRYAGVHGNHLGEDVKDGLKFVCQ